MPYISDALRKEIDKELANLLARLHTNIGEHEMAGVVNYIVSRILAQSFQENYFGFNTAIGVLECAKMELYRRRIGPYETKKINTNGDLPEWKESK